MAGYEYSLKGIRRNRPGCRAGQECRDVRRLRYERLEDSPEVVEVFRGEEALNIVEAERRNGNVMLGGVEGDAGMLPRIFEQMEDVADAEAEICEVVRLAADHNQFCDEQNAREFGVKGCILVGRKVRPASVKSKMCLCQHCARR
jgi:hypothetical protein